MDLINFLNTSKAKINERRREYTEDLSNNKSRYFRSGYNNVINFARDFASAPENPISNKTPLQLRKALKDYINNEKFNLLGSKNYDYNEYYIDGLNATFAICVELLKCK
ncbi:MAG: hypothetical protein KH378_07690 [Butyrivibrio sp.]|nr:hypothetical protein [Butyrivibrio sp.]